MGKLQAALARAKGSQTGRQVQPRKKAAAPAADTANRSDYQGTGKPFDLKKLRPVTIDWKTFDANRLLRMDSDSEHAALGAYRMLRTRLMQSMRSNGWRILGISSIGQNEGKTYTAINLAISIVAEVGQEAVLVDLDLRRPSVYSYLGIDKGDFEELGNYLEGSTQDLSNFMTSPGIDRLGILLGATPMAHSSDLLASPRGKQLFAELLVRLPENAVVIVDLPPLLIADDALAVAPMLDALLLVVAEGQAERSDLADAQQMLQEFNLIGTVLNKSVEKDSKHSHYY
jgi:protein-tyrosine kinase